ncbi:OLC1v1002648C1 [Oldenlandia corymbosa var. corymbosa]|uniref:OLC1v1002648C1 n=1 Tax=Oldenlandia corymbosa var. corymbosa TaxID=529605 RepID=A0AAV1D9D0_OLDCO|nr:OLC1v1002648C1 [Oldenlandia corymbosa var. corymbosa]
MGKPNCRRSKQPSKSKPKPKPKPVDVDASEEKEFSIARIAPDVNQPWPCLLISHLKKKKPILTFHNTSSKQYQSKLAPELTTKTAHKCHGEWMLIQDDTNLTEYCILNPLTMETLQLPRLEEDFKLPSYGG